jgi:hypothetical protein
MYIWGFSFPPVGFLVLPGRFYMPMVAPLVGFLFLLVVFLFTYIGVRLQWVLLSIGHFHLCSGR